MQSKLTSLIEAITNILLGYLVAFAVQIWVFPLFNIIISLTDHALITLIFTIVNMTRLYFVRRFFNYMETINSWQTERGDAMQYFTDQYKYPCTPVQGAYSLDQIIIKTYGKTEGYGDLEGMQNLIDKQNKAFIKAIKNKQ